MKIGICAPSTPFSRADAVRVTALAEQEYPQVRLVWHEQCFAEYGHFAGCDADRLAAFTALANDDSVDAIWFVRGGYGACRIAEDAMLRLGDTARDKIYMGYSDAGNILGALYRAGIGFPVHGPMPADIRRDGGAAAVRRALGWMVQADRASLDPVMDEGVRYAAFNLMTLSMMVGTPIMPDLSGHVVMVEEVSEHLYAFDRAMFHVLTALSDAGLAGIMLGRVGDVPENDRPFGEEVEDIARRWCSRTGIAYLGRAGIGHDADNRVVPFGLATVPRGQ
ncbi:MAG: LD-carboxypeptidase [Sphingomonadales bacterium]|nr:LD-carboxypeptidase [Sphingomonadales bacterium]